MKAFGHLLDRKVWIGNEETDVVMYTFRKNTSLGRMESESVGFMDCVFSLKIQNKHAKFRAKRKEHKWNSNLIVYANGELPAHGKTKKKWAIDFDRIYAPVFVNKNYWIAVCTTFQLKTVKVFDCYRYKDRRYAEPFAETIPRLLKEIHRKIDGKVLLLTSYNIIKVPVPPGLNKTACDCGAYVLKYIECHLLGKSIDLINDDNIREVRYKLAVDLWEAASDPMLIDKIKKFEPPKLPSDFVDID